MLSSPPATSRPQSSQAHGSYEGAGRITSIENAASPTELTTASPTATTLAEVIEDYLRSDLWVA